jgi:hypothetical protein
MSEATIRTAIYNAVKDLNNVGMVYDYERHATEWDQFLDLFKTTIGATDQVRGWMIGYRGITEANQMTFNISVNAGTERVHRFNLLGIMGIDDAAESEKTFAALAEDVCDALDSDTTLHSTGVHATPAAMIFDPAPFSGILVHAARISIDVTEMV